MSVFNIPTSAKNMDPRDVLQVAAWILFICYQLAIFYFWMTIEKWRKWRRDLSKKTHQLILAAMCTGFLISIGAIMCLAWTTAIDTENWLCQYLSEYYWETTIWLTVVLHVFLLYLFLGWEQSIPYIGSKLNNKSSKCELAINSI